MDSPMPLPDDFNLGNRVNPVPLAARFHSPDWHIWCGAAVKGGEGRYHLFYSRWTRRLTHMAWVTDSEIAVAESATPFGPWQHLVTALGKRGPDHWDGTTAHNPVILHHAGRYYLYYMGTTGTVLPEDPYTMADPAWWTFRNGQRIGAAVSDTPTGPWHRQDRPALDVDPDPQAFDSLMVSNPAVCPMPDGRFLMLYKGVTRMGDAVRGGRVRYGVAIAEDPLGPFVRQPGNIFQDPDDADAHMVAEDPFVWCDGKTFWAVTRDVVGRFTGAKGGLALFHSPDGLTWKAARHPQVLGCGFAWVDGRVHRNNVERPWLLLEGGRPVALMGATRVDGTNGISTESFHVQIPMSAGTAVARNEGIPMEGVPMK